MLYPTRHVEVVTFQCNGSAYAAVVSSAPRIQRKSGAHELTVAVLLADCVVMLDGKTLHYTCLALERLLSKTQVRLQNLAMDVEM